MTKTPILYFAFIIALVLTSFILYGTQSGQRFFKWSVRNTFTYAFGDIKLKLATESRCLVQNTYRQNKFDDNVCELCENTMFEEINTQEMGKINDFLQLEVPLVVTNSVNTLEDNLRMFAQSFLSNENLALFHPCQFKSNYKSKIREHRQLLQMVKNGNIKSFYSVWENCAEISYKSFRRFYQRPGVLGNNVQLTGTNWVFICSHFDSQTFRDIETFSQFVTVIVQKGSAEIRLVPIEPCMSVCFTQTTYITRGDTLIFSGLLYHISIRPSCSGEETLLIGVGGFLD